MGTLNTSGLTLLDIANQQGGVQPILVDALTSEDAGAFFRVIPMREVRGWIEKFVRKIGRPTVAFRNLGAYVSKSKAQKEPWQEGIFLLSGASEVDKQTADRDPRGTKKYREEEDTDFLEAMGYNLSYQTFYGANAVNSGFDGLLKRLPSTADTFVDGGATNETTSIYAIKFGPKKFMGIYNLGEMGDLIQVTDYGARITESGTTVNEVYTMVFNAAVGISQYHPKAIGRIGKLDGSNKVTNADFTALFAAMGWKPDILVTTWTGAGYINELKMSALNMTPGDTNYNILVTDYMGIPVLRDPALVDAEDGITLV